MNVEENVIDAILVLLESYKFIILLNDVMVVQMNSVI